ncbi:MAG: hypothetical protein AAFP97_10585, partial [Pseudomonadota bacterium]
MIDYDVLHKRMMAKQQALLAERGDMSVMGEIQELMELCSLREHDPAHYDAFMKLTEVRAIEAPEFPAVDYGGVKPRLIWGAALEELKFQPNGKYSWQNFFFAFLPKKDVNGKAINWDRSNNPANYEQRLHLEIHKDGEMIADHWMFAQPQSEITHYATVDVQAGLTTNKDLLNHNSRLEAGRYAFIFKIAEDTIYGMEAEVEAVPNPDRYADMKTIMRLNGPHQKYLGITFNEHQRVPMKIANKDVPLWLMLYHRNPLPQFDSSEQRIFGHLYYEDNTDSIAYIDMPLQARHDLVYKSTRFTKYAHDADPMSSRVNDTGKLTYDDMKDGKYKIVLFSTELAKEENTHYRRPEGAAKIEYDFEWRGGRFVLPDCMDDQKTDPKIMVEGLGNTLWLEPQNGPNPWQFDNDGKQPAGTSQNAPWIDPNGREDDPWPLHYNKKY